tara:strand:+ start:68 stop:475 length:408 start_codon:yes stop_codon:yes gene_type:complete
MNTSKLTFNVISDERGRLVSLENNKNIPFAIERIYYLYDSNTEQDRGMHAHRKLKQLLICMSGSCEIEIDDASERRLYKLDSPSEGLFIDGVIWREIKFLTEETVLVVLADREYDEEDYIRDYEEFLKIKKNEIS